MPNQLWFGVVSLVPKSWEQIVSLPKGKRGKKSVRPVLEPPAFLCAVADLLSTSVMGYDINRRPVLYMASFFYFGAKTKADDHFLQHPYRQNTETGPAQIDFVVWCLERAIDLCVRF